MFVNFYLPRPPVALLAEGVDRNMFVLLRSYRGPASPSSRRAWIEIFSYGLKIFMLFVALLAEGVDRNECQLLCLYRLAPVALLAEGVDRNSIKNWDNAKTWVALLAEGVDRNLSAHPVQAGPSVALLAEGVDRNFQHSTP